MKIFGELVIIFSLCLAGIWIAGLLPFAFPSNVIAMVLLFALLMFGVVKPAHIQDTSNFLLKNMAFLFLPSTVGIVEHFDLLESSLLPFLAVCIITTLLTFLATAYTAKGALALQKRYGEGRQPVAGAKEEGK